MSWNQHIDSCFGNYLSSNNSSQSEVITIQKDDVKNFVLSVQPDNLSDVISPNDVLKPIKKILKNGMTLWMTVLRDKPVVTGYVAVRAGSRNDFSDATGLAHYLEHMLFKGTSKIAALDYPKESVLLQKVYDLFEEYALIPVSETEKRLQKYAEIDAVSLEASKLVATNEFDQMMVSIGSQKTNAYTWTDQTVYHEEVPSTSLEKWFVMESERMNEVVLRLLHTELEAVYEEFNFRDDKERVNEAIQKTLFKDHPYSVPTIGTPEHLKNPRPKRIHEFFQRYYVPSNMAIILSGDFDPEQAYQWAEKYFGTRKLDRTDTNSVSEAVWTPKPVTPVTGAPRTTITGPDTANVSVAYLCGGGAGSREHVLATMCDILLRNGTTGYLDVLNLKNKTKNADASIVEWADAVLLLCEAQLREGQTHDEVESLIKASVQKLADGEFSDETLRAGIEALDVYTRMKMRTNRYRAESLKDTFIHNVPRKFYSDLVDTLRNTVTREEIMAFARRQFNPDASFTVHKLVGESDDPVAKYNAPAITPVVVNSGQKSSFRQNFENNFSSSSSTTGSQRSILTLGQNDKYNFTFQRSTTDDGLFSMTMTIPWGSDDDPSLPIAVSHYLKLEHNGKSAETIDMEFFALGVTRKWNVGTITTTVTISGLEKNASKAVNLFISNLPWVGWTVVDDKNWWEVVDGVAKSRTDDQQDVDAIMLKLREFSLFGPVNRATTKPTINSLRNKFSQDIIEGLGNLKTHGFTLYYFGNQSVFEKDVIPKWTSFGFVPPKRDPVLYNDLNSFPYTTFDTTKVFFLHYDNLPQARVAMGHTSVRKNFDERTHAVGQLFNSYFGFGLSSVIFQDIREKRGLAYSAYAAAFSPPHKNDPHFIRAAVTTQSDKLEVATDALLELLLERYPLDDLERIDSNRKNDVEAARNKRYIYEDLYEKFTESQRLGLANNETLDDVLIRILGDEKTVTASDLVQMLCTFHQENILNSPLTITVVGDREKINVAYLQVLAKRLNGTYKEITTKDIFVNEEE